MITVVINKDSVDTVLIDKLKADLRSIDNELDQPLWCMEQSHRLTLVNKANQLVKKLKQLDAYDIEDTYDFIVYGRRVRYDWSDV